MIGLSTSLLEDFSGNEIVLKAKELSFSVLELGFRLRPEQARDVVNAARRQGVLISSLHNFVPEPPEGERAFLLSDIDKRLRDKAIELTRGTIRFASDAGAQAVVLHLGQPREWDYEERQSRLRQAIFDRAPVEKVEKLRKTLVQERKNLPGAYLDAMLLSLDRIIPTATNLGVKLGIENRYYHGQFPDFDEIGIILQEFSGSCVGYWHDCGHAAHSVYCGLGSLAENLLAFKKFLIGIHIHDAHLWHDHRVPGHGGDIDFSHLRPFIDDNTILVLEPGKRVDLESIKEGLEYLRRAGIP
jgi:sugar phosphate isomerase/epimerase